MLHLRICAIGKCKSLWGGQASLGLWSRVWGSAFSSFAFCSLMIKSVLFSASSSCSEALGPHYHRPQSSRAKAVSQGKTFPLVSDGSLFIPSSCPFCHLWWVSFLSSSLTMPIPTFSCLDGFMCAFLASSLVHTNRHPRHREDHLPLLGNLNSPLL